MELVKRYSNVSDMVLFLAIVGYVHNFCLKSFSRFYTEGLRAVACTGVALLC